MTEQHLKRIQGKLQQLLKQQVEILKYNTGEMDEEGKKQFEKRLTGYLKEIDRCITLLGE